MNGKILMTYCVCNETLIEAGLYRMRDSAITSGDLSIAKLCDLALGGDAEAMARVLTARDYDSIDTSPLTSGPLPSPRGRSSQGQ